MRGRAPAESLQAALHRREKMRMMLLKKKQGIIMTCRFKAFIQGRENLSGRLQ
jgi:hypothetical protein